MEVISSENTVAAFLANLRRQYGTSATTSKPETTAQQPMPPLLAPEDMPPVRELNIGESAQAFLIDSTTQGDRSHALQSTTVALYKAGLTDEQVFSVLANSDVAMAVALDHRQNDNDKALAYLWKQCRDAKPKAMASMATDEDFMDLTIGDETSITKSRFKLLNGTDLAALPPLRWLVHGVLPATGLAALYGPSASGKSFLAMDMATAVAEGRRWYNARTEARPVVYVALEGEAGFKTRAQAWKTHHGRPLPEQFRMVLQTFKLLDSKDVKDLAAAILAAGGAGALVILDTLNRAAPTADENASKDMGLILEASKALQRLVDGLVLLVHHTGKDTTKGLRGHSSMFAALDAGIEVTRTGDVRAWSVAKAKDGKDGIGNPFRLEVMNLGTDEHGEAITSCVAIPADKEARPAKPLTTTQQAGYDAFIRAGGDQPAGVHIDAWRAEFYTTCTADNQAAKRQAFTRVRKDLTTMGYLIVNNDIYRSDKLDFNDLSEEVRDT